MTLHVGTHVLRPQPCVYVFVVFLKELGDILSCVECDYALFVLHVPLFPSVLHPALLEDSPKVHRKRLTINHATRGGGVTHHTCLGFQHSLLNTKQTKNKKHVAADSCKNRNRDKSVRQ